MIAAGDRTREYKSYAEERHRSDAEAFRNSSWNCYRQPHAWDQAVADQRAFANLAAKADRGGGPALRTSGDPPRCPRHLNQFLQSV